MKPAAALLLALLAAGAQGGDLARQNYVHHCAGCHQLDGSGSAASSIPSMKGAVGHFLRLPEGRAFLVQVPGTSNSPLNDREIAELLNWMLPRFSRDEMPPDFVPYSAEEVTRYRADKPADVFAVRAQIVKKLQDQGYGVR